MARVLITGASGLLGARVVEAFAAGTVHEIVHGQSGYDLRESAHWGRLFDDVRPDVVVHLAWSASATPGYRDHIDNSLWSDRTVEAAHLAVARGIRFFGTGTSVDADPAEDAYSRSKASARERLTSLIETGAMTWLRPFYLFDEERPSPAVLRAALAARAAGKAVALATPGARHDFVHARDAGGAVRTAVEEELTGFVDIGSGSLATVAELVEAYGCSWTAAEGAGPTVAASESAADVSRLRAAGWAPSVTDERLGRV